MAESYWDTIHPRAYAAFVISLLLHLIFLLIYLLLLKNEQKKPPEYQSKPYHSYVQSYTAPAPHMQQHAKSAQQQTPVVEKNDSVVLRPKRAVKGATAAQLMASSMQYLHNDLMQTVAEQREEEPVYLIGDKNQPASGIILVLAKALSKHFAYPPAAGKFGIQGRVVLAMTLHPDGHFSDVEMIQSSENRDLDAAALYAVNSAPKVEGAERFLKKPKRFVIGYLFQLIRPD